jgi:hypothetical protein
VLRRRYWLANYLHDRGAQAKADAAYLKRMEDDAMRRVNAEIAREIAEAERAKRRCLENRESLERAPNAFLPNGLPRCE